MWIDGLVLAAYFAALATIGWRASRRVHSQDDYLLGGRRFGWVTQTFAAFGQATSADGPVGATATTFVNGASGIWSSLLLLFATPIFWITSPWHRRLRLVTMGDFFEDRYGSKSMAAVYAVVGTFGMMALVALGFTAMATTICVMTPKSADQLSEVEAVEVAEAEELAVLREQAYASLSDESRDRLTTLSAAEPRRFIPAIEANHLVWGVCLLVLAYTAFGGLAAAVYSDMLQGVCILILSVAILPSAWGQINERFGGAGVGDALSTLHAELPQHYFDAFGSPAAVDFTWYYVLTASLIAGVTVVVQPNQMLTNSAAKDEFAARLGFMSGVIVKRCCTLLWGALGLATILLYRGSVTDSDIVWGYAARDLLGPGLFGMMVAGMTAALMSTADTLSLTCSGLLVRNLYSVVAPGKSERHYLRAGRVFGAIVLLGSAALATQFTSVLQIIRFVIEFFVVFAPAFWLGLKWRRANAPGAWASIVLSLVVFYVAPLVVPMTAPGLYQHPWLTQQTEPRVITATYTAAEADVAERAAAIAAWEASSEESRAAAGRPEPIEVGDPYDLTEVLPPRSLFWSGGVKSDAAGVDTGLGYLYPEMMLLSASGYDLTTNPPPLNQSIRLLIRLTASFAILLAVSAMTRPGEQQALDRFFLKMRVQVRNGGEGDAQRVAAVLADPSLADRRLLAPGTDWEFHQWNRTDSIGFAAGVVVVIAIAAALQAMVNLGA